MTLHVWLSLITISLAVVFIVRRADVRLVLFLSAVALFVEARQFPAFFAKLAEEMANPRTVVPICSAMGFARALKLTGCDRHLVRLLLRPLRWVRWLLIPGGFLAGYVVNTAIVSQSSSIAAVGPVLIPLLLAGGLSCETAGAVLLLGCSAGGELFNPSAVEVVTIAGGTPLKPTAIVGQIAPLDLAACGVALLAFWLISSQRPKPERAPESVAKSPAGSHLPAVDASASPGGHPGRREATPPAEISGPDKADSQQPILLHRALVPLLPLLLLFLGPHVMRIPPELSAHVMIAAAMVAGVVCAGLSAPSSIRKLSGAFFDGAGWAYANIISLIIVATLFAEGIKANGLIDAMAAGLSSVPSALGLACVVVTWSLSTLCGSGVAPGVAVIKALIPIAARLQLNPVPLGALTAMAAQFGRTMSPVAPVVILSAALAETTAGTLVRRVWLPLLAGGMVLLAAAVFRK